MSSVQFSSSVLSNSLRPHELQHARPPYPITNSWSSPKPTSIESVMPSSHLILCCPLLLLPPIPPSIRVFSNESTLCMKCFLGISDFLDEISSLSHSVVFLYLFALIADRMWSTGEGNGKPLQYSCLENPMNSMKRQNDRILKEELPRSLGAQYATGDSGEITPERMKGWSQSKNNTQLWM